MKHLLVTHATRVTVGIMLEVEVPPKWALGFYAVLKERLVTCRANRTRLQTSNDGNGFLYCTGVPRGSSAHTSLSPAQRCCSTEALLHRSTVRLIRPPTMRPEATVTAPNPIT